MENLILFGGSFDPVHNGHLRMANAASRLLNADVVFIPEKAPKWKNLESNAKDRLEMLKLALEKDGNPSLSIDTYDLKKEGDGSYMIDTVNHFKNVYSGRELYLLVGADQINKLEQWKSIEEIAKNIHIIYIAREGIEVNQKNIDAYEAIKLPFESSGDVSSSAIRNLQSMDIPLNVREYIENHRLYYIQKLSELLSPHRLTHSISVANLSYKIALFNHLNNPGKAYIAGLLHDIGKNLNEADENRIMIEHFSEYINCPKWMFHQFTGSLLIQEIFGVKDEEIIQAIRYHASANEKMNTLGKIVYAADKIEPGRGYDSSEMIKLCYENYHSGFIKVLKENRIFYESKGMEFDGNPLTKKAVKYYLGE